MFSLSFLPKPAGSEPLRQPPSAPISAPHGGLGGRQRTPPPQENKQTNKKSGEPRGFPQAAASGAAIRQVSAGHRPRCPHRPSSGAEGAAGCPGRSPRSRRRSRAGAGLGGGAPPLPAFLHPSRRGGRSGGGAGLSRAERHGAAALFLSPRCCRAVAAMREQLKG